MLVSGRVTLPGRSAHRVLQGHSADLSSPSWQGVSTWPQPQ